MTMLDSMLENSVNLLERGAASSAPTYPPRLIVIAHFAQGAKSYNLMLHASKHLGHVYALSMSFSE